MLALFRESTKEKKKAKVLSSSQSQRWVKFQTMGYVLHPIFSCLLFAEAI